MSWMSSDESTSCYIERQLLRYKEGIRKRKRRTLAPVNSPLAPSATASVRKSPSFGLSNSIRISVAGLPTEYAALMPSRLSYSFVALVILRYPSACATRTRQPAKDEPATALLGALVALALRLPVVDLFPEPALDDIELLDRALVGADALACDLRLTLARLDPRPALGELGELLVAQDLCFCDGDPLLVSGLAGFVKERDLGAHLDRRALVAEHGDLEIHLLALSQQPRGVLGVPR